MDALGTVEPFEFFLRSYILYTLPEPNMLFEETFQRKLAFYPILNSCSSLCAYLEFSTSWLSCSQVNLKKHPTDIGSEPTTTI